jgi:hypothetical protein
MTTKIIAALCAIYATGFFAVFAFHIVFLQMVTPGLAFARAAAWPQRNGISAPSGYAPTINEGTSNVRTST